MDPLASTLVVSQTITDRMREQKSKYHIELARCIQSLPPSKQMQLETKLNEIFEEMTTEECAQILHKWQEKAYLVLFRVEHGDSMGDPDDHWPGGQEEDHWFSSLDDMAHYVYKWLDSHKEIAVIIEENELQFKRAKKDLVSITKDEFIAYWKRKQGGVRFEHECTNLGDIGYIMIEFHDFNKDIQVEPKTHLYL